MIKRLQLCAHYMITIVQLTSVYSQARKKIVGKLDNEAGMLFSGGIDCGQPLTQANRPSQGIELPVSVCLIAVYELILDLGTVKI